MNKEELIKMINELPIADITVISKGNEKTIHIVTDDWMKYCSDLDDDTFTKSCEVFNILYKEGLNDFANRVMNGDSCTKEKELFKKIAEFVKNY